MSVANRLQEIDRVNDVFNEFAERENVPVALRRKMNICFDEILNNIVTYGYDGDDERAIDIDVKVSEGNLIVTITDDGKPFNPFDERSPDVTLSVEDRPIGGLGVHLVRNIMDRVSYERHGEKNVVRLEKTTEPEETQNP